MGRTVFFIGGCILAATLACVLPNPWDPDICTSMGYGLPSAARVDWCPCIEGEPSIRAANVGVDSAAGVGVWALIYAGGRGTQKLRRVLRGRKGSEDDVGG